MALKCLRSSLVGNAEMALRMQQEVRILAKLRDPNIVMMYDAGIDEGGTIYMAMELLEGRTLHEAVRIEGKLWVLDALRIALEIAEGVQTAHEFSVIHRDLKPANVFLTTGGQVKVLDFGIAKIYGWADLQSTDRQRTIGTPHYMSPEHLRGEKVDARTDIYAVGLMLYEMLAGCHAFAVGGESPTSDEVSQMQLYREPSLPPGRRGYVPAYVWGIVERALRKRREDRYGTMGEVIEDVRAAMRRALAEGETSKLFPKGGVASGSAEREGEDARMSACVAGSASGGAEVGETAAEGAEAGRFWRTRPRGEARREREREDDPGKTVEVRPDRGGRSSGLATVLPFRSPARASAGAGEGASAGEGCFRRDDASVEMPSEARATSAPTATMPLPVLASERTTSRLSRLEPEDDLPTQRTGAYPGSAAARGEGPLSVPKLPREVLLALVFGPLVSSALTFGMMRWFEGPRGVAAPPARDVPASASADPVGSSQRRCAEPPSVPCALSAEGLGAPAPSAAAGATVAAAGATDAAAAMATAATATAAATATDSAPARPAPAEPTPKRSSPAPSTSPSAKAPVAHTPPAPAKAATPERAAPKRSGRIF